MAADFGQLRLVAVVVVVVAVVVVVGVRPLWAGWWWPRGGWEGSKGNEVVAAPEQRLRGADGTPASPSVIAPSKTPHGESMGLGWRPLLAS